MERTMNLIEQYIIENIPIEIWRAACASSPESNDVCGLMLVAAGLLDRIDDSLCDLGIDDSGYVATFFAAEEKLNQELSLRGDGGRQRNSASTTRSIKRPRAQSDNGRLSHIQDRLEAVHSTDPDPSSSDIQLVFTL